MIKINLLKNSGLNQGTVTEQVDSGLATPEVKRAAFFKVLVVLGIPALIYAYEDLNLRDLREQVQVNSRRLQQLNEERSKYGDAGPRIEQYTKEKKRIDGEIEVIRNLARSRLREVKTFDSIQSLMPVEAWAKKISIDANTVKLEGFSSTEDGTSNLIRALESSPFFARVEPKRVSQETQSGNIVKRFEIEFRIGKNDR